MKKQKKLGSSDTSSADSNELYQNVIDLDKSPEPPSYLLHSIFKLLEISPDDFQTPHNPESARRTAGSPKLQWALRWCLNRMSKEGDDANSFLADVHAWKLLHHLIRILPSKISTSLLISNKFSDVLSKTLAHIRASTKNRSVGQEYVNEDSSRGVNSSKLDEGGHDKIVKLSKLLASTELHALECRQRLQTKKRKHSSPPSDANEQTYHTIFKVIFDILSLLQLPVESQLQVGLGQPTASDAVFRFDSKSAVSFLADGLEIVNNILQDSVRRADVSIDVDINLVEPFVNIWESVVGAMPSSDIQAVCLPFLGRCLGDCLRMLHILSDAQSKVVPESPLARLICELLACNLILPYRSTFQAMSTEYGSEQSRDDNKKICREFDILGQTSSEPGTIESGESYSFAAVVPLVFRLAFDFCKRETITQRVNEDPWLEAMFQSFLVAFGINLTLGAELLAEAVFSDRQIETLHRLMQIAQSHKLKISRPSVQAIAMYVSKLSSGLRHDGVSLVHWKLVSTCLRSDSKIVIAEREENHALVTDALLEMTHRLSQDAIGSQDNTEGGVHASVRKTIIEDVLPAFLDAFASNRQLTNFLDICQRETQRGTYSKGPEKEYKSGSLNVVPWLRESFLDHISQSMAFHLSSTQTDDILRKTGDLSVTKSGMVSLSALIICNCAASALISQTDRDRAPNLEDLIVKIAEHHILGDEVAFHSFPAWRVWRLLNDLTEFLPLDPISSITQKVFEKLATKARKRCSKILRKHSTQEVESRLSGIFAFQFLFNICRSDRGPTAEMTLQLSDAVDELQSWMNERDEHKKKISAARSRDIWCHFNLDDIYLCILLFSDEHGAFQTFGQDALSYLCHVAITSANGDVSTNGGRPWVWRRVLSNSILDEAQTPAANVHKVNSKFLLEGLTLEKECLLSYDYGIQSVLQWHPKSMRKFESLIRDKSSLWAKQLLEIEGRTELRSLIDALPRAMSMRSDSNLGKRPLPESSTIDESSRAVIEDDTDAVNSSFDRLFQIQQSFSGGTKLGEDDMRRLQRLKIPPSERTAEAKGVISQILSSMLADIRDVEQVIPMILISRNVVRLMSRQGWAVTQFHIDTLLGLIDRQTSKRSSIEGEAPSASAVFTCLSRLLACIFSGHRAKIGGRWHLLVPALRGLLRCLFTVPTDRFTRSVLHQATWCSRARHGLDVDCATQLSRLLTSLCDPTVSAAKSVAGSKSNDLNDPTKKARSIAGQNLQSFVIEYCACQLQGSLEPSLRKALEPGMHSIMDAMRRDAMQNMSSSMDASQRAIFKAIYDDWRRSPSRGST